MIKIIIADDHTLIRQGLRQLISTQPDLKIVDEVSHGDEVIRVINSTDFDILIQDINMPGRDGLEILKYIKETKPQISVLIVSMYSENQYAIRAMKAGASGYVTKQAATEELIDAIYKISNGRKYISPSLAELLADELGTKRNKDQIQSLSDRELQVLRMISRGMTQSAIGKELSLSVKTVGTYRTRILEKLKLHSTSEMIRFAYERKLIE